ncbi:hypothetical protein Lalb_Chr01g0015801 [Lupinus albus]|uniref:Uncharacterized protein n=1 Tax=Lupinus albus TaxID=3870 RepID=A0A6A4R779_LUPAL|nr:hypothetical protein Lalb_Chr01g0015801 [Lupinus albus]
MIITLRNNEMSQQYLGSGQYQQNLKYVQYPPNLNSVDRLTDASHQSSNANPDGGSADVSNVAPHSMLEKLDYFCMEGKMKEAVDVLELLEKQHVPVDLPRYLKLMSQWGEGKSLEEALLPLTVSTYNRILDMCFECVIGRYEL